MPRITDIDCVIGEARHRRPAMPVRYKRERDGELVHVNIKRAVCIPDGSCCARQG